jgi:hypothetical protein
MGHCVRQARKTRGRAGRREVLMKPIALLLSAMLAAVSLAACERSQTAGPDKTGRYQGKEDNAPWNNEQFKGDKVAWEKAVKDRNLRQNEYRRTN